MTLADWMKANDLDDVAVGARIGKSRASVSRYRRGIETPGSDTIRAIVRESNGRVTANELLGIDQGQAAE